MLPWQTSAIDNSSAMTVSGAAPAYTAHGVAFDGSASYLLRSPNFTSGIADSKFGILSAWVWMKSNNGALNQILTQIIGSHINYCFYRQSTGVFGIQLYDNVTDSLCLLMETSGTYTSSMTGYTNILMSWDLRAGSKQTQLYVNDASDLAVGSTNNDVAVKWNDSSTWTIGANGPGNANFFGGWIADLYLNIAQPLDLSVTGNRRLFTTGANGHPVNLGNDGSIPTGSAPLLFQGSALTTGFAGWPTNRAGNGDFTVGAAISDAASNP